MPGVQSVNRDNYDACPACGWVVDYGCMCPDARPTYPLVKYGALKASRHPVASDGEGKQREAMRQPTAPKHSPEGEG